MVDAGFVLNRLFVAVGISTFVVVAVVVEHGNRESGALGTPRKAHVAQISYWDLAGPGNRVVVQVHTGCQEIKRTTEDPESNGDHVAVIVAGPANCFIRPTGTLLTLTLHHGGFGCHALNPLIDAATGHPLETAPGRSYPVFNCPAVHSPSPR